MTHRPGYDRALADLQETLGERFVTTDAVRAHHGRDESPLPPAAPDAVAFCRSEDEVSFVLRTCSEGRVPVVPFGAGTSLEGHVLATGGGVSLDLSEMSEIVDLNIDDLDVTVEAGVTRTQLEEHLRPHGLFFPVDPGADATIGGMAATGASGTTTVRYRAMRENVLSLRVALADGRVIETGHRARKSSAGYDLTRLFVGSEGTLGVITRVTLRVYGIPEVISSAVCHFNEVGDAIGAVIAVLQTGVPVARIEFLDESAIAASNAFSDLDYPVAPTLFLEFHGSAGEVADQTDQVAAIVKDSGGLDFTAAVERSEGTKLWRARHDSFYASLALKPGARAITTDACVPISHLGECILASRRDVNELGLTATTVGHVGDGNFHLVLLVDPDDDEEMAGAEEVNRRLVRRALAVGGTCTGEHGIGLRKRGFLKDELGEAVEVMKSIKSALDPHGVMNPGKVFV